MSSSGTVVIVGAGLAAAHAVAALREGGYDGHVLVYGSEPHHPYERPPLSKGYLLGTTDPAAVFAHPASWYDEHDVDLRLGSTVTALDLASHHVMAGSDRQRFDKLLLATGAQPRRLPMADDSGAPVAYLRTIENSDRLRSAFTSGARVVIIGAGWIGLEVAAAARLAGAEVDVVETLEQPLLRVLGAEVGQVFADLHRDHGVTLRLGVQVSQIRGDANGADVLLADGTRLEADLVVVGIGVNPDVELARTAGLAVDDGVLVDASLRTSHPDVFAAGDVANAEHPRLGRRVRVEHWDNAIRQGAAAGRSLLGEDVAYDRLPYFFTDQYDLGMEYVGHVGPEGYDEVILRGDVPGRVFTAFWVSKGRLVAGMHAGDWDAIGPIRTMVTSGVVDLDTLRDPGIPLAELAG
ncbi:MAG TPA: FAD-dependent oxidoreductase [Nocardioidaceae bacterium]|nr:FAD-dependent oxidoreductase [Nocardioidaceae bacterium]